MKLKIDVDFVSTKSLRSSVRLKNGRVVMSLSRYLIGRKRQRTIDKFLLWANKKLAEVSDDFVLPKYVDGGVVVTHNKLYRIAVEFENRKSKRVVLSDEIITVFAPMGADLDLRSLVSKKIMEDQLSYLQETIDELNQLYFQEKVNSCRFKRVKSRFGSCSSKRNINIAYRLLFAPREVFRYVCVHELAHLKEMNHSSRFWGHVACAMPEYKEHEKWLKKSGFMLG